MLSYMQTLGIIQPRGIALGINDGPNFVGFAGEDGFSSAHEARQRRSTETQDKLHVQLFRALWGASESPKWLHDKDIVLIRLMQCNMIVQQEVMKRKVCREYYANGLIWPGQARMISSSFPAKMNISNGSKQYSSPRTGSCSL